MEMFCVTSITLTNENWGAIYCTQVLNHRPLHAFIWFLKKKTLFWDFLYSFRSVQNLANSKSLSVHCEAPLISLHLRYERLIQVHRALRILSGSTDHRKPVPYLWNKNLIAHKITALKLEAHLRHTDIL